MEYFRRDNTEGYSAADLTELNARFDHEWQQWWQEDEMNDDDLDDFDRQQMRQHIGEQVQKAFDREHPHTGRVRRSGYYDVED